MELFLHNHLSSRSVAPLFMAINTSAKINLLCMLCCIIIQLGCSNPHQTHKGNLSLSCEQVILQMADYTKKLNKSDYDGSPRLIFVFKITSSLVNDTVISTPQVKHAISTSDGYFSLNTLKGEDLFLSTSNSAIKVKPGETWCHLFYLSYEEFKQPNKDYFDNYTFYKHYLYTIAQTGKIVYHPRRGSKLTINTNPVSIKCTPLNFFDLNKMLE